MENISIKLLDALFDLCEGESYVILDKADFIARFSDYDFATDELTEILEALSSDGFIDLKYADNQEFCLAMKTKGRTLVKQTRDRLQRMMEENSAVQQVQNTPDVVDDEKTVKDALRVDRNWGGFDTSDKLSDKSVPPLEPIVVASSKEPEPEPEILQAPVVTKEKPAQRRPLGSSIPRGLSDEQTHFSDSSKFTRGYTASASEEDPAIAKNREKKVFWAGFLGAATAAIIINLIFLIIILIKLK